MENTDITSKEFEDLHIGSMEYGFWSESSKRILIKALESDFKTGIIREWYIEDIVINMDKILYKWKKRFEPLTNERLKDEYGR